MSLKKAKEKLGKVPVYRVVLFLIVVCGGFSWINYNPFVYDATDYAQMKYLRTSANFGRTKPLVTGFPNHAIADIYHLHDRLLVKSLVFFNSLTEKTKQKWNFPIQKQAPITIVILAVNRKLPYIDLLVYMLMQGHSPEYMAATAHVHVIDAEQRVEKKNQDYLSNVKKIGFVKVHDFSASIPPGQDYGVSQKKFNQKALEICKKNNSAWCIILEDDALPPGGFLPTFTTSIMKQLLGKEHLYAFVKLFYPFNNALEKKKELRSNQWVAETYDSLKAETSESLLAKNQNQWPEKYFTITSTSISYGGWAMAFPKESIQELLDLYDSYNGVENIPDMNDVFMNDIYPLKVNKIKARTEPSMIGHIGLYSEQDVKSDFSRLFADIRFQPDVNSL